MAGNVGDPPLFFERHVFCCVNARPPGHPRGSCREKKGDQLYDYMRGRADELGLERVRINAAGCLDRCEVGPVMVIYPEGVWYHVDTTEDVDEILRVHVMEGGRVARLMLRPETTGGEEG